MNIAVSNRIYINLGDLTEDQIKQLKEMFTYENPKYQTALDYGWKTDDIDRYICTFKVQDGKLSLPRGRLKDIDKVLGTPPIKDERLYFNEFDDSDIVFGGIKLEGFQMIAENLFDRGDDVFLRAPTGSGKTEMALYAIAQLEQPTLIIVPNKNIMDEWIPRIMQRFDLEDDDIGKMGGGYQSSIKYITVGIKNTVINNNVKLRDKFGLIVCDEAYSYGAKTFNSVVDLFPARYRLGLSAWEKRKDSMEFLIYDQFGTDIVEITLEEIESSGRVVPVRTYMVKTEFNSNSRSRPILINKMTEDEDRNCLILKLAKMLTDQGEKIVIFSERIEHCRLLQTLLETNGMDSAILMGKLNIGTESLKGVKEMFEDDIISVLITNRVGVEGISISVLSSAICTYPVFKSIGDVENDKSIALQQAGRVRRKHEGKSIAKYFYLWDHKILPGDMVKMTGTFGHDKVRILDNGERAKLDAISVKYESPPAMQKLFEFSNQFVKNWRS